MKKLFIILGLSILLLSTSVLAGNRRTNTTYNDGSYVMVPDVGECDKGGCVISEKHTEQWDGLLWLHQSIDITGDGVCDFIRVWKPISDPTYGVFYSVYETRTCGSVL
jgi:hypothetical protein